MNKFFKSGLVYYSSTDLALTICGMGLFTLFSGIKAIKCIGLIFEELILNATEFVGLFSFAEMLSDNIDKIGWEDTSLSHSLLYNFLWAIPNACLAILSGICTFKLNKYDYNCLVIICCALVMGVSSIPFFFAEEIHFFYYIIGLIPAYISLKSIHLVLKVLYRE